MNIPRTMTSKRTLWKFQTDSDANGEVAVHSGYATDARGLRLRQQCGYGWVNMGDGWLQLSVAIKKLESREALAKMMKEAA